MPRAPRNRSLEDDLADLQTALTQDLMRRVKSGQATAAELAVARQFLKDNGIDALRKPGTPLDELANAVPFNGEDDITEDDRY